MRRLLNPSLVTAVVVSAVVVLSAPFLGQARAVLRAAFPGQFVTVVAVAVALTVAVAAVAAVLRIRHHRVWRYGAIAVAGAVATGYSLLTASGVPEVDVVERVHFVEYGAIAGLFYLGVRGLGDAAIVVLPVVAALITGTLDEWLQWFIPNRVGEARDVFLNLIAIMCGLTFAVALEPTAAFTPGLPSPSRRLTAWVTAVFLVVFAGFVDVVHFGHWIDDGDLAFKSRYGQGELRQLAVARAEHWRVDPPATLKRLSREDHYLDEGLWHIRERNRMWDAGDVPMAFVENEILERYFAPVIDTPSYAAPASSRWPAGQRADVQQRLTARQRRVSAAEPYPILAAWGQRRTPYWLAVLVTAALIVMWGRRQNPSAGAS